MNDAETMHAITISDKDRSLSWQLTPRPKPERGEVLVQVHATALNRADLMQRKGLYPPPPGASEILGLECAGVVTELGLGADERWLGQRVCALLSGGGYAQYVAVPQALLLPMPASMSYEQATALPEVLITAFVNLFMETPTKPGQWVMLHAGASGVGTAAIQLCKARGVKVIAVASGSKLDRLKELGADVVVDRHTQDFVEVARGATQGQGVDVILDPVGGGDYLTRNIEALAPRGAIVLIGLMGGREGTLSLGRVLVKRLRVLGSVLRSRSLEEKTEILSRFEREVWPLVAAGQINPIIDRVMSIEQAHEAHDQLAQDDTVGKIVLTVPT